MNRPIANQIIFDTRFTITLHICLNLRHPVSCHLQKTRQDSNGIINVSLSQHILKVNLFIKL